tara:strand:- start:231 stop:1031 length:801 start_codon:yes stop_codon:yes gene_type:complete
MKRLKLCAAEAMWRLPSRRLTGSKVDQYAETLTEKGCCVIENFLPFELTERLERQAEGILTESPEIVSLESNGSDMRIYGIDRVSSSFIMKEELRIADELMDSFNWRFFSNPEWFQLFGKIIYTDDNLGSGSGWHRDSPIKHQFKILIYLTDVHLSNGPFQYIEKSHTKDSLIKVAKRLKVDVDHYRFTENEINTLIEEELLPAPISVVGPKGTALLADTRGLHRGMPLREGERKAITRYYFDGQIPKHFLEACPVLSNQNLHKIE